MESEEKLILQILNHLKSETKIPHPKNDLQKFISSCEYPILNDDQLNSFLNQYHESNDLLASLLILHEIFIFDPLKLKQLLAFINPDHSDLIYARPFIYMNALAYIVSPNVHSFKKYFSVVLSAIFSLTSVDSEVSFFLYFFVLRNCVDLGPSLLTMEDVLFVCAELCTNKIPNSDALYAVIDFFNRVESARLCKKQIYSTFEELLNMLNENNVEFDDGKLCDIIIKEFNEPNENLFDVILALAKGKKTDTVRNIYAQIPKYISDFMKDKHILIEYNKEDALEEFEFEINSFEIQCEGIINSKNWPEVDQNENIFDDIFEKSELVYLNRISKILPYNLHKNYFVSFIQSFEQELEKLTDLTLFFCFIYITSKIKYNYFFTEKLTNIIFNDFIFDPSFTIFNTNSKIIFPIRNYILALSFQFCESAATSLFKKCEKFPLFFSELLLRSMNYNISKLFNHTFLCSFTKVYFALCHKDIDENQSSIRSIYYIFVKTLLQILSLTTTKIIPPNDINNDIPLKYIEKELNTYDIFLKVVFEKSFRNTITFDFKRTITKGKSNKLNQICNCIGNVIKIIAEATQTPEYVYDVLDYLLAALKKNSVLSYHIKHILFSLLYFTKKVPTEKNLILLLSILANSGDQIDISIIYQLSTLIPEVLKYNEKQNWDLNNQIIKSLFQLASPSSPNFFSEFIIEKNRGVILNLIFSIFTLYGHSLEFLNILNSLCDYSTCNRIRLHDGGVDETLLEIYLNYPNDFMYHGYTYKFSFAKSNTIIERDNTILDLVFLIFIKIALTKSNHVVTERVMKIICCSKLSLKFINFFIPINSLFKKYAVSRFPLILQQLLFEAKNISSDDIKNGISISFWLFIDNPIAQKLMIKSPILTISNFLKLEISYNQINLLNSNDAILTSTNIQTHHWNSIILNIHESFATIYINGKSVSKVTVGNPNKMLSILVGNNEEYPDIDNDLLLSMYSFANYMIYDHELNENEIEFLSSEFFNIKQTSSAILTNYKSSPENQEHTISTNNKNAPSGNSLLYSFPNDQEIRSLRPLTIYIDTNGFIPQLPNLIDILKHKYPIETITPLFSNISKMEHHISLISAIEDIFGNRFSTVSEIISYLISTNNTNIFSYELYLNFYKLLKNSPDKEVLFDSLLVNCDLWIKSQSDNLVQIVKHWSNELFNEFPKLFFRKNFFIKFISEIRSNFYISSKTIHKNRDPILNDSSNILSQIIQYCLDILIKISKNETNKSQAKIFLQSLLKSDDSELVSKMVTILPNILNKVYNSNDIIKLLLCLDFEEYPNAIHNVISSLYLISNEKFYFSTIVLCYQIPLSLGYNYFESDLLNFPELFTVCLMTALQSSPTKQNELSITLHRISLDSYSCGIISQCSMWFIWPILFALQTNEAEIMSIFIVNVLLVNNFSKVYINPIFSFLDLLNTCTTFNATELKCSIIKGVFEMLDDKQKNELKIELLELGFEALFTVCRPENNSYLFMKIFQESLFNTNNKICLQERSSKIIRFSDLKLVLELDFIKFSHMFTFIDRKHFSKTLNSFFQIYFSHVERLKNLDYMHQLLCFCSQYPNFSIRRKNEVFNVLDQYESKLTYFTYELTNRTKSFCSKLKNFFKIHESPLQDIDYMKKSMKDPLVEDMKIKNERLSFIKQNLRTILKHFVHPRAIFDIDCFQWKREFYMSPNFTSNKLKRSITLPSFMIHSISPEFQNQQKQQTSFIASYPSKFIRIHKTTEIIFNLHKTKFDLIHKNKFRSIKLSDIAHIMTRARYQKKTAIEFFLNNGHSLLIDFSPVFAHEVIKKIKCLDKLHVSIFEGDEFSAFIQKSDILNKWLSRSMSTFDFLMQLNMFAGRSFHDPENYLIFPWVVTSSLLSPNETSINIHTKQRETHHLRDFNRPMAAQTDEKQSYYRKVIEMNTEIPEANFVFGSAPSNAMLLSYYFVRIEPFTTLHKKIHDGKFDIPERMFRSIDVFFAGLGSGDESRESTPEFFSMPEMFFDLSKEQQIGNLICNSGNDTNPEAYTLDESSKNIFDTIYNFRKILESDEVSLSINKWIDLLFGISQRGEEAIKRCNLFNPFLYEDVWDKNITTSFVNEENIGFIKRILKRRKKSNNDLNSSEIENSKKNNYGNTTNDNNSQNQEQAQILTLLKSLGSMPPVVFQKKVNERKISLKLKLQKSVFKISDDENFISAVSYAQSRTLIKIFGLDSNGSLIKYNLNITSNTGCLRTNSSQQNIILDLSSNTKAQPDKAKNIFDISGDSLMNNSNSRFPRKNNSQFYIHDMYNKCDVALNGSICLELDMNYCKTLFYNKTLYIADNKNLRLLYISNDQVFTKGLKMTGVHFLLPGSENTFYTIAFDGSIAEWNSLKLERPKILFRVSSDSLTAAAISNNFSVFACSTNDGNVEIYSTDKQRFVNVINLDGQIATNLLISPNLGFIIIKTFNSIWITTINGFIIKKTEFNYVFDQIITWSDEMGIDWVAAADNNGCVWIFEAYYPENAVIHDFCSDHVIGMNYDPTIHALIVITQKSTLHIIPL